MFHCAGTDSAESCPKSQPREQSDFTLYTLASRLQKQKARFHPCMVTCNSFGYFSSSAKWLSSCFKSLSFISLLCHLFPILYYQNTNLSLFLILLPTTKWLSFCTCLLNYVREPSPLLGRDTLACIHTSFRAQGVIMFTLNGDRYAKVWTSQVK
jgi:hypothetical protein